MSDYTLVYDADRLTVDDLCNLEEAKGAVAIVKVLGRHMMNGGGEFLEPEEGEKALRSFSINELRKGQRAFLDRMTADSEGNAS